MAKYFDNPGFEPDDWDEAADDDEAIDGADDTAVAEVDTAGATAGAGGAEVAMPSWADGSSAPPGTAGDKKQTEALIGRWQEERGKVQADLEFASTAEGGLWVRWGRQWLRLTYEKEPGKFLAPATIIRNYRTDVAKALGVYGSVDLSQQAAATLGKANQELGKSAAAIDAGGGENIPMQEFDNAIAASGEATAALTMTDPPERVAQAARKLSGEGKAMTRNRDKLVNINAKIGELDRHMDKKKGHLARERVKLSETSDESLAGEIQERITDLEEELSDMQTERDDLLEEASAIREDLRTQINRIRETINRVLHEDKTLAERIRTLFREQGITIASILTAIGMAVSTLVLALTGGGGTPPSPPPAPSDKGGFREWAKKTLHALGRVLAKLAGKAAAALPGIIGSVVSWLLGALGKTAGWLAGNLWAVVVAVGGLLLLAAREWLTT